MVRTIEVTYYDVAWIGAFNQEAVALSRIFGDSLVAIHHIGSTSIPGLLARFSGAMEPEWNRRDAVD